MGRNNSISIDCIQIGFQKCGTTFLEKNYYSKLDDINFLQIQNHQELDDLFRKHLIMSDGCDFDKIGFLKEFNLIKDKYFSSDKRNIIMYESLTFTYQKRFDRKRVLENLKEVFPDTKIVLFIRNQEDWIKSHYSQYIRAGGLLSFYDFIESMLTNPYLDASYILWNNLIEALYAVFNKKNVKVLLYEELRDSQQTVCNSISDFLQISKKSVDVSRVNKSLSKEMISFKRLLNHIIKHQYGLSTYGYSSMGLYGANPSRFEKFKYDLRYKIWRPVTLRLCKEIDRVIGFKGKLKISDYHHKMISDYYRENNEKLDKTLNGLPSKYNYSGL